MITKKINDWCDKQFEEANDIELNEAKRFRKATVSGLVRGMMDASVVLYPVMLIACSYWKNQALKK